ncbi:hypothetical protein OGAPHI_004383 [Ogataea philodendri]|uniref:Uncharacterized protein n=1 Tax=Ogataea philodendri TaxID=1378263 RepID=A0A9P8P7P3_9ASCO|nr:uncharacterized protein OGAPHI_004383 [Ogataea philodendri]KAH3666194.1 hypothetical protein OGAPHI_004383 [Ogataea philodendri]
MLFPETNVALPLVTSLLEVFPGPLIVLFMDLGINTIECILEPFLRIIFNGSSWTNLSELLCSQVPTQMRSCPQCIAILMAVQIETKLIKEEFPCVMRRRLGCSLFVDCEMTETRNRLQNILRIVVELGVTLDDGFEEIDELFMICQFSRGIFCIPIDTETTQCQQFPCEFGDSVVESWNPIFISRHSRQFCQGETQSVWVFCERVVILISEMNILDGDLQIIDNFRHQTLCEAFILGLLVFGIRQNVVDQHLDRFAFQIGPWNLQRQFSNMTKSDVYRKFKLLERLLLELQILQLDVSAPNTNVELFGIKVLNISPKGPIEDIGDKRL